ncbi:hypothetical protein [Salinivirga cyanobacteriivorans]
MQNTERGVAALVMKNARGLINPISGSLDTSQGDLRKASALIRVI